MGKETRIGFHHVFLPWSAVQGWVSIVYLCSKHKNDLAFRLVTKRTTERGSGRFSVPHAAFLLICYSFPSPSRRSIRREILLDKQCRGTTPCSTLLYR